MAYSASSDIITNLDATPVVRERTAELGGRVYSAVAEFTSAVFDALTAGQTAALARIPLDARLIGVFMTGAATGDSGAFDIGFYRATSGDPANTVIDADAVAAAVNENVERQHTALGTAASVLSLPAAKNQTLREALAADLTTAGASNDAHADLVVTITTVMGTAKAVAFEAQWTI